jgi:hypothetical protein
MAEGIAADEEQRRVLTETLPPGTVADSKAWRKVQGVEEPEWWNTAALVRGRVEEAAIRIDQISVAIQAFAGRHDPDLEVVYFDILCTWELDCGGKLTFSRDAYSQKAEPTGDLITYFEWAANFILENEAQGGMGSSISSISTEKKIECGLRI